MSVNDLSSSMVTMLSALVYIFFLYINFLSNHCYFEKDHHDFILWLVMLITFIYIELEKNVVKFDVAAKEKKKTCITL